MEFLKPVSPDIPPFLLISAGFIFARWKKISLASVTEIIVYLGTPSLVFSSLASKPLYAGDIAVLLAGILLIFAGVGFLIRFHCFIFHFASRGFALPSLCRKYGHPACVVCLRLARDAARDFDVRDHYVPAILARHQSLEWARQLGGDLSLAVDLRGRRWSAL